MDIMNEQYDVIEIFGRRALFTNNRVDRDDLPEGLRCYDLRHGDSGRARALESDVYVNHFGTVLCMTDFGLDERHSYIPLNYNTEPNFLGEDATIAEYMAGWEESDEPLPKVKHLPARSAPTLPETELEQDDGLEP